MYWWGEFIGLKDGSLISEGYISLQSESHPAEFRGIELFNLKPYMNNLKI